MHALGLFVHLRSFNTVFFSTTVTTNFYVMSYRRRFTTRLSYNTSLPHPYIIPCTTFIITNMSIVSRTNFRQVTFFRCIATNDTLRFELLGETKQRYLIVGANEIKKQEDKETRKQSNKETDRQTDNRQTDASQHVRT